MKVAAPLSCVWLVACSSTPTASNEPVERCSVTECFNHVQVRNYEVIDSTTLVMYVGGQRCPFLVEFDGTFCDLTFLPGSDILFKTTGMRQINMRICSNDRHIGIDEGAFSTAPGGDDATAGRLPCQIRQIASLTDDQLIELYVENGITAPPPPFGNGEIQKTPASRRGADGAPSAAPDEQLPVGQEPTAAAEPR
jgi:hypothetical protein